MSITKRQFGLLTAMDITVWQRRELTTHGNSSETVLTSSQHPNSAHKQEVSNLAINISDLPTEQLFIDIMQCLGVSSADVSLRDNKIDLGIINWQFSRQEKIEFKHNCLITPEMSVLAQSIPLKKLLWQSLQTISKS